MSPRESPAVKRIMIALNTDFISVKDTGNSGNGKYERKRKFYKFFSPCPLILVHFQNRKFII